MISSRYNHGYLKPSYCSAISGDTLPFLLPFSLSSPLRPAFGSDIVDPTTVNPDSSAAFATADAKSASAKNEPSELLSADERLLPQLELSVTLAHVPIIEPEIFQKEEIRKYVNNYNKAHLISKE